MLDALIGAELGSLLEGNRGLGASLCFRLIQAQRPPCNEPSSLFAAISNALFREMDEVFSSEFAFIVHIHASLRVSRGVKRMHSRTAKVLQQSARILREVGFVPP